MKKSSRVLVLILVMQMLFSIISFADGVEEQKSNLEKIGDYTAWLSVIPGTKISVITIESGKYEPVEVNKLFQKFDIPSDAVYTVHSAPSNSVNVRSLLGGRTVIEINESSATMEPVMVKAESGEIVFIRFSLNFIEENGMTVGDRAKYFRDEMKGIDRPLNLNYISYIDTFNGLTTVFSPYYDKTKYNGFSVGDQPKEGFDNKYKNQDLFSTGKITEEDKAKLLGYADVKKDKDKAETKEEKKPIERNKPIDWAARDLGLRITSTKQISKMLNLGELETMSYNDLLWQVKKPNKSYIETSSLFNKLQDHTNDVLTLMDGSKVRVADISDKDWIWLSEDMQDIVDTDAQELLGEYTWDLSIQNIIRNDAWDYLPNGLFLGVGQTVNTDEEVVAFNNALSDRLNKFAAYRMENPDSESTDLSNPSMTSQEEQENVRNNMDNIENERNDYYETENEYGNEGSFMGESEDDFWERLKNESQNVEEDKPYDPEKLEAEARAAEEAKYKIQWGKLEKFDFMKATLEVDKDELLVHAYENMVLNVVDMDNNAVDPRTLPTVRVQPPQIMAIAFSPTFVPKSNFLYLVLLGVILAAYFGSIQIARKTVAKKEARKTVKDSIRLDIAGVDLSSFEKTDIDL